MPQARNRPRRNQPAAAGGQSDLLQFLETLNQDIFCETLLPMLIQDGSAGNLAATCSQLRKLCHSSIKNLNLRPLLSSDVQPSTAEEWTQNLQEHFPHCSSVVLQVREKESYHVANYVLPALARLPDLTALALEVKGPPIAEMLPMAMLLLGVRTQLTSLQSLTLKPSQSWSGARLAWAELAAVTQLTHLHIQSLRKGGGLCSKADLLQLSRLDNLQNLYIDLDCQRPHQQPVSLRLVSELRDLTSLTLSHCSTEGFNSLGNCDKLQTLMLLEHTGVSLQLSAADWGVLGQLTQLTSLVLWSVTLDADCAACVVALQQLTALCELAAVEWPPEVLTGLQGMSHLTALGGGWLPSADLMVAPICAPVNTLVSSFGHVPCNAFPNLLHVSLDKCITPDAMAALSRQCPLLQSIRHTALPPDPLDLANVSRTLPAAEPVADRVSAVRSLSGLQHLTGLDLSVSDGPEMHAVCQAAVSLVRHKLEEVRLIVDATSEVSSANLLGLAQLAGLKVLRLWILSPVLMRNANTAQSFVAGLPGLEELQVVVASEEQHTKLTNAFERVGSWGLQLPLEHTVSILQ